MQYIILSDVHANYTALEAVLEIAGTASPEARFYFLGDLLGYGPYEHALRCLTWLRGTEAEGLMRWIPGNHDEWAVTRLGGMRTEGKVTLLTQQAQLQQERPEDWAWFTRYVQDAPLYLTEIHDDGRLLLVFAHGSPEDREAYLWPWKDLILRVHFESVRTMADADTKVLFCGHSHLPFLAEIMADEMRTIRFHPIHYGAPIPLGRGEYTINPGSVGHPRDGDRRASFAIFDPASRSVTFHRVEYDIQPVIQALHQERHRPQTLKDLIRFERPDLERIPLQLRGEYHKKIQEAYDRLIHEIETGKGGKHMQYYLSEVYHRTQEGNLQAVNAE